MIKDGGITIKFRCKKYVSPKASKASEIPVEMLKVKGSFGLYNRENESTSLLLLDGHQPRLQFNIVV